MVAGVSGPSIPPTHAASEGCASALRDTNVAPLDDTAESQPDTVTTLAEQVSKRAQIMLLREQSVQQDLQLRLERMRADFNASQEERSEQLREMNALRDMSVDQSKKDDEILKKYIAMI